MVGKKKGSSSSSRQRAVKSTGIKIKRKNQREAKVEAGLAVNSRPLRSKSTLTPLDSTVSKRPKVVAKKTTVRAPILKSRVNKGKEERESVPESESDDSDSDDSQISIPVSIEAKAAKNKGGRKKKEIKAPKADSSPKKGGRPRAVNKFLGGQRLALIAKESFVAQNKHGSAPSGRIGGDEGTKSLVIESKTYNPRVLHRARCPWSEEEVESLTTGVERHGEGSWSAILNDADLSFNLQRTQIDLKDKWRNMKSYVKYSEHPIRRFVLLNSKHEPIISPSGNTHVFKNRWPRDAAMKVATRSEFYNLPGEPGQDKSDPSRPILIYLREVMDETDRSCRPPYVHVYRGTRVQEPARNIAKFKGLTSVWTAAVEKLGEEILISQNELDHIQTKG